MATRAAQMTPRAPQELQRKPQDGPRRSQDGAKMAPRRPQDGPKTTPSRFQAAFQNNVMLASLPNLPRCAQDRPRTPPGKPKRPPKSSQEAPRGPQEAPKAPRGPQEASTRPLIGPTFTIKMSSSCGRGCVSHLSYQDACNMSPLGSRRGPALRAESGGVRPLCQIPKDLFKQK